ncbi:MAG: hypothetical protein ACE5HL_03370 [Terriglobia bacterium]
MRITVMGGLAIAGVVISVILLVYILKREEEARRNKKDPENPHIM